MSLDIGNATASEYDGKHLTVQVDGYGEDASGMPYGEGHMLNGVMHRPADPELDADGQPKPEASCGVVYWHEGGRIHAIAADDPRIHAKLPPVGKGETIVVCSDGCFLLLGANGIQAYAPKDGAAHVIEMKRGGAVQIRGAGGASVILDGAKATLTAAAGSYIEVGNGGITLGGNVKVLGALSGPTAPSPVLNSPGTPCTLLNGFG